MERKADKFFFVLHNYRRLCQALKNASHLSIIKNFLHRQFVIDKEWKYIAFCFHPDSHSLRSLLLYKTHVFLEMMMRKSKSLRASFLIVPCTALQWRAHQSCLQLEQNNIVTAATAPKRRKDFSRFSILVQVIEGESSLRSPLNCQRKAELLSFSYRSNLPSYSVIHKFTLNSWVFLKTSYLPVPQDSSLAGKLKVSIFNFLRWSGCFLRRRGTC